MSANQTFSRTEFLNSVRYNNKKSEENNIKRLIQSDPNVTGFFFFPDAGVAVPLSAACQDRAGGAGSQ